MDYINFGLFTSSGLHFYSDSLLTLIGSKDPETMGVKYFYDIAVTRATNFNAALFRCDLNKHTKLVSEANTARGKCFVAFRDYVEACATMDGEDAKAASAELLVVINQYGDALCRQGYKEQTSSLDVLIDVLSSIYYEGLLRIIDGVGWYERLKTAAQAFKDAFQLRIDNSVDDTPTIEETRKPLTSSIRKLVDRMILLNEETPTAELSELLEEIDNLSILAMTSARAARTRRLNKGEEQETDDVCNNENTLDIEPDIVI